MVRLAANLSFLFNEIPFVARFSAAARCGFRAVEFLFPYEHKAAELSAALRQSGLEQALFNAPPGDWAAGERGLGGVPGREQEFRDGIHRALEYATELRCKTVHVMAGTEAQGAREEVFVERVRWADEQAVEAGVRLCVEPLNGRDMPGKQGGHNGRSRHSHCIASFAQIALPATNRLPDAGHDKRDARARCDRPAECRAATRSVPPPGV